MTIGHYRAGPNLKDAYQLPGIPFLTASTLQAGDVYEINFPYVTRFITFTNKEGSDSELAFGFSENGLVSSSDGGLGNHHFTVDGGDTLTLEIRTKQLFISNSAGGTDGSLRFNILAGLTTIRADQFPLLTGTVQDNGETAFEGVG